MAGAVNGLFSYVQNLAYSASVASFAEKQIITFGSATFASTVLEAAGRSRLPSSLKAV